MSESELDKYALRQKAPKPTRFNRILVGGGLAVFAVVVSVALVTGLQGPQQAQPGQVQTDEEGGKPAKNPVMLPPAIANQPSSYAEAKARGLEKRKEPKGVDENKGGQVAQTGRVRQLQPLSGQQNQADPLAAKKAEEAKILERVWDSGMSFKVDSPDSIAGRSGQGGSGGDLAQLLALANSGGAGAQGAEQQISQMLGNIENLVPGQKDEMLEQNQQKLKSDFVDMGKDGGIINSSFTQSASPYILAAGDIIPVVLQRGINTDLPGDVVALVTQNVFDSYKGKYRLIPQGSRVFGRYQSVISYGQERVLVVWRRLCRPDGGCVDLGSQIAVDTSGYAGLHDEVDNHYGKLFGGVLASSLLSAGAATSQGVVNRESPTFGQLTVAGAGEEINDVGGQITQRNLNVQPTLTIRPGQRFNIQIDQDFLIPPYSD